MTGPKNVGFTASINLWYISNQQSGDRVHWFRAHAEKDRSQEAFETDGQYFRNMTRSFGNWATIWEQLSNRNLEKPGYRAYALQKSAMYERMKTEACDLFSKAGGTWPREGECAWQMVLRERKSFAYVHNVR